MKKIVLAFVVCCAFSAHEIATNSDTKLKRIEMIEKKISALKAECSNIENRLISILDEGEIYIKKGNELDNETKIPEIPIKVLPSTFPKKVLAKTENDIKMLEHGSAIGKLQIDINLINVNIGKANIELIKAEIKAGKTPKIPLELANAALKLTKSSLKSIEAGNKHTQARLKENEAKIKYLEAAIKTQEER
ncbi:MAG: hypothetical protein LBL16_00300, partial [Endomicrobium sp.]|nr:hypothetical protein [Endomicrobium sp.]